MRFKTSLMLAVAASAMIFGSSFVMAEGKTHSTTQPDKAEHKKSAEEQLQEKLDTLGLSDDQRTKIATVIADFKKSNDSWEATNGAKKKELTKKLNEAKKANDEAQTKQATQDLKALTDTEPSTKKLHEDIKALLTPEQAEKFEPKKSEKPKGEKTDKKH